MAIQLSDAVRNARLDALETAVGATAVLKLRTGAQPATVATADSGTVLATLTLPSDWMSAASGGTKALLGSWRPLSQGGETASTSNGTTAHMQGTVTATGGGGDLTLDNVVIAAAQNITITGFTLTDANA